MSLLTVVSTISDRWLSTGHQLRSS